MGSLPHVVEDCMGVLQLYSDGSIFREKTIEFPMLPVNDETIMFKDCLYNKKYNLYLRLYKPKSKSPSNKKFPIVFYMHGGGFCVGTKDWPNAHNCCLKLASGLKAIVVAPDYRLAPEHRLPAAIEDGLSAINWVQAQALSESGDAWFYSGDVDFDYVFVVGDSSGGNMAHHLAVQVGARSTGFDPVRVRGFVLLAPFFGGEVRTISERGPSEQMLSLDALDRFWRLSLPIEASRDHPFANPFGPDSLDLEPVNLDPILVIAGRNELLKDRAKDYARRLRNMGKNIEYLEFEGKEHGFFTNNPYSSDGDQVIEAIKKFMLENTY